jgi:hypothetical protein
MSILAGLFVFFIFEFERAFDPRYWILQIIPVIFLVAAAVMTSLGLKLRKNGNERVRRCNGCGRTQPPESG